MLWDTLQIFGYKSLGEGDEQTGGFFGGNVGNVEVHQARISDGVLNFPLLDWIKLWTGDINSFTLANCRYSYSCIVKTKDSKGILAGSGDRYEVNPKVGRVLLACSLVYSESVVIKRRGSFVMNHRCLPQWLVTVQKLWSVTVQKWKKYIFTFYIFTR